MKKYFPYIPAVLLCALMIVCLVRIGRLEDQLRTVESNLQVQLSYVQNNVSAGVNAIQNAVSEGASTLESADWQYGEPDYENGTVELYCTIQPKTCTPGVTTASIVCNGDACPMNWEDGAFTASLSVPLYTESELPSVSFEENGTLRSETLDWTLSPRYSFVPYVYAQLVGRSDEIKDNGSYALLRQGDLSVDIDSNGGSFSVEKLDFVAFVNGEEVSRVPLDVSSEAQKKYWEEAQNGGAVAPARPEDWENRTYLFQIEETFPIPMGGSLLLCVELTDANGICYRAVCDSWQIDENGEPCFDEYHDAMVGGESILLSADGTVLYDPYSEME